jgi:adenylate cyclase class IV
MMQSSKNIEIEFRSRFDKKKYISLEKFFRDKAEDLGDDDKNVIFFILPDKLLKVVNNVSKKTAKLVLKLNKIGKGSDFKEIEIPINPLDFEKAKNLFTLLGYSEAQESFQKRHNYNYKGVEISLKHSKDWGYHAELEIMVSNPEEKHEAEERILKTAKELDIHIMSDKELSAFTQKRDAEHRSHKKYNLPHGSG